MMQVPVVESLEDAALRHREAGRWADAFSLYTRAAALLEADDPNEASKLWSNAGVCALKIHEPDKAVACIRNAIETVTSDHPDRRGRFARLYANLTAAYYQGSRIRESWDAGRQALLLAEEREDPLAIGSALYNLGLAERYLGEFSEALKLFAEARRYYKNANAASEAADALHNKAWVHLDRYEFEDAEAALRQAREEKEALGESTVRIDVELARLSLLRGNWIEALLAARQGIETPEALTDPITRVQALIVAADAARYDSMTAALYYADTGLALAQQLGTPPILLDLMPLLVRIYCEADLRLTDQERELARNLFGRRHGVSVLDGARNGAIIH